MRAWGGAWGDALKAGVADPFTEMTGVPVRLDFTEDNEIKPKIWAAVDQGRVPPIHVNWDTTTNATISARRDVPVDLADLPNLGGPAADGEARGAGRVPAGEHVRVRLCMRVSAGGVSGWPANQLAGDAGAGTEGSDRALRRRNRLQSDRGHRRRRHDRRRSRQHGAGLGVLSPAQGERAAAGRGSGLHHLVPERRDRPRLHDLGQRPRGAAERHRRAVDGAGGGLQGRHRRSLDPARPAGETRSTGRASSSTTPCRARRRRPGARCSACRRSIRGWSRRRT